MNTKPYPKYKASGVEWLGDVPEHWEVKRLKWVGEAIIGLTYSPDDVVNEGDGTLVLRSSNIQNGKIVLNDNVFVSSEIPRRLRTKPKDIVICTRNGSRALVGKTGMISEQESDLTFGAFTAVFRSPANDYMFYVFNSGLFSFQAGLFQTSTIFQLTNGTINSFLIPLPPSIEQQFIADFLDERTGKLDGLLGKKRELIVKLKEKRSALISRTVTKGLPGVASAKAGLTPNPKLKPSGIPWLGDVPEHWEISKAGYFISITSGFAFPSNGFTHDENDTRLLRGANIGVSRIRWDDTVYWPRREGDRLDRYELKAGDLVLGMDRPWISEGMRVARISEEDLPCLLLQRVVSIKTVVSLSKEYFFRLLSCQVFIDYFTPEVTGVSVPHISPEQISSFLIPLPPLDEQLLINDFLEMNTAKLDQMIQKVETAISKLTEYRSALITAAVTGKIDVRRIKS